MGGATAVHQLPALRSPTLTNKLSSGAFSGSFLLLGSRLEMLTLFSWTP